MLSVAGASLVSPQKLLPENSLFANGLNALLTATQRMLGGSVLWLSVFGGGACSGGPTQPSAGGRSIVVNGVTRTYTLHVPASFHARVGALVVALHGAG